MADYFIIKTNRKEAPNWSGKEWSQDACKIYTDFTEATDALRSYWFGGYNAYKPDNRAIIIKPLTERQAQDLIDAKKIRW